MIPRHPTATGEAEDHRVSRELVIQIREQTVTAASFKRRLITNPLAVFLKKFTHLCVMIISFSFIIHIFFVEVIFNKHATMILILVWKIWRWEHGEMVNKTPSLKIGLLAVVFFKALKLGKIDSSTLWCFNMRCSIMPHFHTFNTYRLQH